MYKNTLFLLSLFSLLITPIHAKGLPEITALFSSNIMHKDDNNKHYSQWYIWRTHNKIEISHKQRPYGEIWHKSSHGNVSFEWIRHDKKFKIIYPESDLASLEIQTKWQGKATMINKKLLSYLSLVGTGTVMGQKTERYKGKIGQYSLEIEWMPAISLPAYIKEQSEDSLQVISIKQFYPIGKAPWQRINSDNYDDMDYADIGDNEAHPVARSHIFMGSLTDNQHH
ncbi:MAG: hypothetical protein QM479_11770 [Pseudomonadota bacterium]